MDPILWMVIGAFLSAVGLIGAFVLVMRLDPWIERHISPTFERWINPRPRSGKGR